MPLAKKLGAIITELPWQQGFVGAHLETIIWLLKQSFVIFSKKASAFVELLTFSKLSTFVPFDFLKQYVKYKQKQLKILGFCSRRFSKKENYGSFGMLQIDLKSKSNICLLLKENFRKEKTVSTWD
jgi:hypothetical protein